MYVVYFSNDKLQTYIMKNKHIMIGETTAFW